MKQKNKGGRPPKPESELLKPITLRLSKEIDARVRAKLAKRHDGVGKGALLRELIVKGLDAQ